MKRLIATLCLFLVLPVIQAIGAPPEPDKIVYGMDTASLPPEPEPEVEQEEEPEEEEEPPPPEMSEEPPPIDLGQLELALNPGPGEGWMAGDFSLQLNNLTNSAGEDEELLGGGELDQEARVIYQSSPSLDGLTAN